MSSVDVRGKRFLITHTVVHEIMGSTVVALELAQYLRSAGADVVVYASYAAPPMLDHFAAAGIRVVDDAAAGTLALGDFDYVWVHSQVLPLSLATELAAGLPSEPPIFVFHHMSALETAADEHPYMYGLEDRLSSLSLFVSQATRDKLAPWLDPSIPVGVFPNPAPSSFVDVVREPARPLSRILIVSNHPPEEVLEARDILRERGLDVSMLGRHQEQYGLLDPSLLSAQDVVVTIGKTAQYCLVAGVPVFIYDHFGGTGYLDDENHDRVAYRNFSGRGDERLPAERIADALVSGYEDACRFHLDRRAEFIERYSLRRVVPAVLSAAHRREIDEFEPRFALPHVSAQRFGARYYRSWGANVTLRAEGRALRAAKQDVERESERTVTRLRASNDRLRRQVRQARAARREAEQRASRLESDLAGLRGSRTFRLRFRSVLVRRQGLEPRTR